jgi:pimeloyl-ACP methyl ester carboxylesterase
MKPALILLHGGLGDAKLMTPLSEHLNDAYQVICPDFPGHGSNSNVAVIFSIDHFTDFLQQIILDHDLHRPIVFGYSMGGYVALNHVLKYPGRLGKVVTYGTKFRWNPDEATLQSQYLKPQKMEEKVPHFVQLLQNRHGDQWQQVVLRTADLINELGQEPPLTPRTVQRIDIPTYILLGNEDKIVTIEESERLVACIPDATFRHIKGLHHEIEKVDPAILASHLKNCLS